MKERVKSTCGKYIYNSGTKTEINFIKYEIDYTRDFYLFDIIPMGAVRMTKSDTWKLNPNHADPKKRQRKSVTKYFEFKNNIKFQAEKMNIEIKDTLDIVFVVPIPDSFSDKKKAQLNATPCKKRPDIDNYVKAFLDALKKEDGDVWNIKAIKVYGFKGAIILFN